MTISCILPMEVDAMVKELVQRDTKIAAPLIDVKRRLRKGRRSQAFIGGVGGCAVNHRGATYQ